MSSYLSETKQQLVCVQETSVSFLESSIECITVVSKLVAALHNESHGVVMTGRQLVTMKDDDLSSSHHLLSDQAETHPRQCALCVFVANLSNTQACKHLL